MHIISPSNPLRTRQPEEQFAPEVEAVRSAGFDASMFSLEDFQSGTFRAVPPLPANAQVLYRGWMLSATEYESFVSFLARDGADTVIDLQSYLGSHHLPHWYPALSDLTPETRIYPVA